MGLDDVGGCRSKNFSIIFLVLIVIILFLPRFLCIRCRFFFSDLNIVTSRIKRGCKAWRKTSSSTSSGQALEAANKTRVYYAPLSLGQARCWQEKSKNIRVIL